jgi:phosphoribosylformylglycinamidine synthase
MCFAGGRGATINLQASPLQPYEVLFSESNTRFIVEVHFDRTEEFVSLFSDVPFIDLGSVSQDPRLRAFAGDRPLLDVGVQELKEAWQRPLRW